jgi:antitoxin VapB
VSLNIKNPETTRLIRELADATGESLTQAVTNAVRERLERVRKDFDIDDILAMVDEMTANVPPEYWKQDFDAMLYDDETGLPK